MTGKTTKPHPTPGVWRTRVWQSKWHGDWEYRMYLADGGALGGGGFATEAEARRGLARRYHEHFGLPCRHLNDRSDYNWLAAGRRSPAPSPRAGADAVSEK